MTCRSSARAGPLHSILACLILAPSPGLIEPTPGAEARRLPSTVHARAPHEAIASGLGATWGVATGPDGIGFLTDEGNGLFQIKGSTASHLNEKGENP